MPKAPSPEKQQVEIEKKPQTPQEQAAIELLRRLEKPVQPPPISDTLEKAQQALNQAARAKQKTRTTWYCTECGTAHIQLHLDGEHSGHFTVDLDDGEPVNPSTGNSLLPSNQKSMDLARKKSGK